jgi:hypothetical protein
MRWHIAPLNGNTCVKVAPCMVTAGWEQPDQQAPGTTVEESCASGEPLLSPPS